MSYGLATTWGWVNDDQFLFQVNCPFKGKFSRVELLYVLFQVTSAFSDYSGVFPYHIVFPLQQLCIVGDIWLDAPDSCSIWPLRLPIVPTHRSNSDYVIVCLPFRPLIQILTLLLSLSLCPSVLLLNVWLQWMFDCSVSFVSQCWLSSDVSHHPCPTIHSWIIYCYCDHLFLFQLPLILRENSEWNITAKKQKPRKKQSYWLYEEYSKISDQYT